MPAPRHSSQYIDVKQVFDYALAKGGAKYKLGSRGQATNWRQRAYSFRARLREEMHATSMGLTTATPYDALVINIVDTTCVVTLQTVVGELTALDGTPAQPEALPTDALDLQLEEFKKGFKK